MKILLVDDEPFVLKLLTYQLNSVGFTDVLPYQSAAEAIVYLEQNGEADELVIFDLQMPELDGIELMRHLARIRFAGSILVVSGEDDRILTAARHLAQAHGLNVLGALRKPTTAEQFWTVLGSHSTTDLSESGSERKHYAADVLRCAIAAGELVNYYQPKVNVRTGEVVGVETLVRWRHPDDGMVQPNHFVGLAEDYGLIDELTGSVLAQGLRDAGRWRQGNVILSLAVNVSMENLGQLNFPELVAGMARGAGVPTDGIILEVTESRLMRDPRAVLDILTRLRLKHVGLSIDDFGTGYASLAQLRDIPFDELKVDQGFVHGAHLDPALRAILEASLGMAQQLGIKTVAEGVEDLADWSFMRGQNCELAQGYFIARPMPAEDVVEWMAGWKVRYRELEPAC